MWIPGWKNKQIFITTEKYFLWNFFHSTVLGSKKMFSHFLSGNTGLELGGGGVLRPRGRNTDQLMNICQLSHLSGTGLLGPFAEPKTWLIFS